LASSGINVGARLWVGTETIQQRTIIMKCPHCNKEIPLTEYAKHFAASGGRVGGKATGATEKQKEASRINGMLGGRPRKIKKEDSSK